MARRACCSLLVAAVAASLLAPLVCQAGGIVLEAGDPAPFSGILIPERELATILAEKNRQREEMEIRHQAELEEMQVRLDAARREAELLRQALASRDDALLAVRERFEAVKGSLNRWRFGLGLLILKSPEHIE